MWHRLFLNQRSILSSISFWEQGDRHYKSWWISGSCHILSLLPSSARMVCTLEASKEDKGMQCIPSSQMNSTKCISRTTWLIIDGTSICIQLKWTLALLASEFWICHCLILIYTARFDSIEVDSSSMQMFHVFNFSQPIADEKPFCMFSMCPSISQN